MSLEELCKLANVRYVEDDFSRDDASDISCDDTVDNCIAIDEAAIRPVISLENPSDLLDPTVNVSDIAELQTKLSQSENHDGIEFASITGRIQQLDDQLDEEAGEKNATEAMEDPDYYVDNEPNLDSEENEEDDDPGKE